MTPARLVPMLVALVFAMASASVVAQANESKADSGQSGEVSEEGVDRSVDPAQLDELVKQIRSKTVEVKELRSALAELGENVDASDLKAQLAQALESLNNLKLTFSQLVTGGVTIDVAKPAVSEAYNWQDELVDVVKPVLSGLKELTEKPRQIEEIRDRIATLKSQQRIIDKALENLKTTVPAGVSRTTAKSIESLRDQLNEQQVDANSGIEVAMVQLRALEKKSFSYQQTIVDPIKGFFVGRGLTLLIAFGVGTAIWFVLHFLTQPLTNRLFASLTKRKRRTRERVIAYLYRAFVVAVVALGVLAVFYLRSDVLLLALSVLAIAGIALAMRSLVPKYIGELRILLNAGSVREGERVMHEGLPMEVQSINAFAILRNPELEGFVRVPLSDLQNIRSRPAGPEPWFPSSVGDTLIRDDGSMAVVMRQTLETVQLRTTGTVFDVPTVSFATSSPRNISRDGFVFPTTFGIDYQHQDICLTLVPDAFQQAVEQELSQLSFAPYIESVTTTFKEAATNSLDYLVLVSATGEAASSYFAIGRAVQKALVQVCTDRNWGIPFAQLTVHTAPGELDKVGTESTTAIIG